MQEVMSEEYDNLYEALRQTAEQWLRQHEGKFIKIGSISFASVAFTTYLHNTVTRSTLGELGCCLEN